MLTLFGCVSPIVIGILAYKRGLMVRSEEDYRRGYEDGADASTEEWHNRMYESDRRHEARLQDIIAVATRPDARVILPEMPNRE
jgi:hypothetical protein